MPEPFLRGCLWKSEIAGKAEDGRVFWLALTLRGMISFTERWRSGRGNSTMACIYCHHYARRLWGAFFQKTIAGYPSLGVFFGRERKGCLFGAFRVFEYSSLLSTSIITPIPQALFAILRFVNIFLCMQVCLTVVLLLLLLLLLLLPLLLPWYPRSVNDGPGCFPMFGTHFLVIASIIHHWD